ncbi:MAG: hypothetical protein MJ219_02105 [Mycoplasmoidaceae bacterium]|nr:hypothetical protein [Mycoplasmoidaceae bacterium]
MSDISGKPDVVITDTSYYSGNINSAYRMLQLYEYINNHRFDITGDAGLMVEMLRSVAQMNNESYYLSKIPNMPDVCVYSQLKGNVTPEQRTGVEIEGVRLIHSKDHTKTITSVTIDNGGSDIMARENGSLSGMTLHIYDKTPLTLGDKDRIFQQLTIPCERGAKPEILTEGIHSFNMPSMDIGIIIHYKVDSDPTDYTLSTKLNIHYGTLLLDCKPIN